MLESKVIVSSDSDYEYITPESSHGDDFLKVPILAWCKKLGAKKVLDLGCGDGSLCKDLHKAGFQVSGCDPSESGIKLAKKILPEVNFKVMSVYDDPSQLGESEFDVVISTEVVEHLFYPRSLPQFATQVLKPNGHLIVSAPYHGYLKNLLLSIVDKWDFHHTPLWDGGHIKFWSKNTLSKMLDEEGFKFVEFIGAGRFSYLWKSMILVAQKQD